jgi:mannose-1-phosphate guanylyltransferase
MENAYALIMAGGAGTRLWPLSRQARPKPLIPLVEQDRSMFQIAVERLHPLFPPERVMVVASGELTPQLQAQAPQLPAENFIVEPAGRDTAPAVGLGAIHVRHRHPDAVMAVLTADHHIADEATFRRVLGVACRAASQGGIVTLGIKPGFPSTGFGYIERGPLAQTVDGVAVYALKQFREKPDEQTAAGYVASGEFSWNSGMFIWQASRVLAEFARHAPDIHDALAAIAAEIGQPAYQERLSAVWPTVRKTSVDYALMEHVRQDVYVIPVEMGWNDIGNFDALYDILTADEQGNVVHGRRLAAIDSSGTLVFSDRLVATIGLEDVVIVDTDDALLVCRRDRAQDVKQIVEWLKKERQDNYL